MERGRPSRNPVSGNVAAAAAAVSFDHDSIKPTNNSRIAAEQANLWITKGGGWEGGCVKKREMTI